TYFRPLTTALPAATIATHAFVRRTARPCYRLLCVARPNCAPPTKLLPKRRSCMPPRINPFTLLPRLGRHATDLPHGVQDPVQLQHGRYLEQQALETAQRTIADAYYSHGGPYSIGVFGHPAGGIKRLTSAQYQQSFDWGVLRFHADTGATFREVMTA